MVKNVCKIDNCNKEFEDDKSFHLHLRSHKITQVCYYQKYYPRRDKLTGELILFKNKEFYFNSDFNNKVNFKKWFFSISKEEAKQYVFDFLKRRKENKNLIFAPSQIELKTLMVPGIKYINDNFGSYDSICEELNLKIRFNKNYIDKSKLKNISNKIIFKDSREQKPLSFDNRTRKDGLNFGDYRISGSNIYIERKSIGDAWGTLTTGFERFEREIIRAKEAEAYLVVVIEGLISELESFPYQRQVYGKIKLPVEFVFHNIRELMQKYEFIQFLFVKNREEASKIIQLIFSLDKQVKDIDLQYLMDIGKLL